MKSQSLVSETLQVIPVQQGNGPFVWHMSHGVKGGGPGSYPSVDVPAKVSADFTITIQNPGNITFSNDPIWIQKGTAKPTGGVDGQITGLSGQGTTVLKFHDSNADTGALSYVLNFANVPAGSPTQLDPIINNQGGGPGFVEPGYENIAIIGAVALLAVLLVVMLFRRRSAMPQQANVQRPTDINQP
jgi:hypothetical protein